MIEGIFISWTKNFSLFCERRFYIYSEGRNDAKSEKEKIFARNILAKYKSRMVMLSLCYLSHVFYCANLSCPCWWNFCNISLQFYLRKWQRKIKICSFSLSFLRVTASVYLALLCNHIIIFPSSALEINPWQSNRDYGIYRERSQHFGCISAQKNYPLKELRREKGG